MTGPNRRAYLGEIVAEYLDAGVGRYHWREIIEKLIEDGHTTYEEIGRDFGVDGFFREVIRRVARKRDVAGFERYFPTKTGGYAQPDLMDLGEIVWVYYVRKNHASAALERCSKLRQYIIDRHRVDPDEMDDPTSGKDDDSDGDDE